MSFQPGDDVRSPCPVDSFEIEPDFHRRHFPRSRRSVNQTRRLCDMRILFTLGAQGRIQREWRMEQGENPVDASSPKWLLDATTTILTAAQGVPAAPEDGMGVAVLRRHVRSMYRSRSERNMPHTWDPLFASLAMTRVTVSLTDVPGGIHVREESQNECAAALMKMHAQIVDFYIENGPREAAVTHPRPTECQTDRARENEAQVMSSMEAPSTLIILAAVLLSNLIFFAAVVLLLVGACALCQGSLVFNRGIAPSRSGKSARFGALV